MGQMGHKDLMVTLVPVTNNVVVVTNNTRAMEAKLIVLCFKMIIACEMTFLPQ